MVKDKSAPKILSHNTFPVVGIGASAGGLDAFRKLLAAIPERSGMAYVLVQHLDPNYDSALPELLQKVTPIPVSVITDEMKVLPDHIYIIPSNRMVEANDGILQLMPRPESGLGLNLPINLFFTSLAEVHQAHAIGVVLSGTASDGTSGLKAIKDYGGITFAQDEASAEYSGMPQSAALAGVVDFILPPEAIVAKLLEIKNRVIRSDEELQSLPKEEEDVYKKILLLLHMRKGTDFTFYKQTTIRRRILRRMAISKADVPLEYLKHLLQNNGEQDALYGDLLISVTDFFRDPKVFDAMCDSVFPAILENKTAADPIRIWVAACSTGQEAYSMAICLLEYLGDRKEKVQIFATDLSEAAIAKARRGTYSKTEVANVSPERLAAFFTEAGGKYRLNKVVRDMVIFAAHNFLKDPPFGKMDFVSCRNVLIYLEPYLQKRALTTFHYALNPKSFLLLGKSETISSAPALFAVAGKSDKLYTRKDVPGKFVHIASIRTEQGLRDMKSLPESKNAQTDFGKTADEIILSKYTPAGVVVNEAMDIVHFRGNTDEYLMQAPGKPTHNLLKMARTGLAFELRSILHKAKKEGFPTSKDAIPMQVGSRQRLIDIEAIPLPNVAEPHYLILFHDRPNTSEVASGAAPATGSRKAEAERRIIQLETELAETREDMRAISEDQEAVNEELQSANEELLSSSEEMQSLNEELETSKEELQSTNEELTILNQELSSLNEIATNARAYAESVVATIHHPLLVLDKHLRVKSANDAFYQSFHVKKEETEGALIYDLGNRQWNIPALRTLLEEIIPERSEFKDYEVSHKFSDIGERIMLLSGVEIKREEAEEHLILITIRDVTDQRTHELKEKELLDRFQNLVRQAPAAICIFEGPQFVVTLANEKMLRFWDRTAKQVMNRPVFEAMPDLSGQGFEELLLNVHTTGKGFVTPEAPLNLLRNGRLEDVFIRLVYEPYYENGHLSGIMALAVEITDEVLMRKKLEESEKQFRQMADCMPQKVWTADGKGNLNYINQSWQDYSGTTLETLKDWQWERIVHPDDWAEPQKVWQHSIDTGEAFEVEHRFLGKDGIYRWNLTRGLAQKDEDGIIRMWIGTNTEFQEQKEEREGLEKAVQARTTELKAAHDATLTKNDELQNLNLELESFTYVASHDLQEPLRKIQTFAALIRKKELSVLSDAGRQSFERIENAAARMQKLIQDLLAFSHANRPDDAFEETDLTDILAEVMAELADLISEKGATVHTRGLCNATINPFQFRQVMQNLFTNALKFAKAGVAPSIHISCEIATGAHLAEKDSGLQAGKLAPDQQYCHITFSDNGIGFEPEYTEKMFEVFQRLNTREHYAGTGIGLAIVRKIAEQHHGAVTASGEVGIGATFNIYIPSA